MSKIMPLAYLPLRYARDLLSQAYISKSVKKGIPENYRVTLDALTDDGLMDARRLGRLQHDRP